MTNNQLAENSVTQLLNNVKLARDNAERDDNRVYHSFYYALARALEELQERRKAAMDSEPVYQCEFCHADASGELQWHWEDVNEAFYEQYDSERRGQRRILYSAPQSGPVVGSEPAAEVLSSRPGNDTSTIDRALPVGTPLYRHAQPAPETEREPIAWLNDAYLARGVVDGEAGSEDAGPGYIPVYREASPAQPAPVVPDAVDEEIDADDHPLLWSHNKGWNACRAAMLQAQSDDDDGEPTDDERIMAIDGIHNCERCGDEGWVVGEIGITRCACGQAGNSPVIPDGYVMVPKEPTERMVIAGFESEPDEGFSELQVWEAYEDMSGCEQAAYRARLCWAAMLAAAPQPQNEQQNIPEIIPGWIPVSERMPDDDDFVYIWPRPDFGVELHVGQYCECSPKGDGWYAQVYEQNYGIEWFPITVTHWMPLPAAPQENI